jgi:cytochrome c oxidase cbb3-type subunit 3
MSKQQDQLMGHAADNDGIEEYDNPLPDWWIGLFIFTILFGIGYTVEYHFISNRSQDQAYIAQLEDAKVRWPEFGKAKGVPTDAASIAEGQTIYATNCVACHGASLEGGIGPNLTDAEWVHGGTPDEIAAVVANGVAAKGMPAWGGILGPEKVAKVTAFVVSKAGSAPAAPAPAPAAPAEPAAPPTEIAAIDFASITPEMLASGEQVYTANCMACHQADMTGLVGPNLIDAEWVHGGTLTDIVRTVTNGVPNTAMIAWKPVLGDEKVRDVSAYIYSKGPKQE